jgi:hypothetical protein
MFKRDNIKRLLTLTAIIEAGTGLLLVAFPSLLVTLLLGSSLDTPVAIIIVRIAGVALITLGIACWFARSDGQSSAAKGLVAAMMVYNAGILLVLLPAGISSGFFGPGLWFVALVHAAMFVWCLLSLLKIVINIRWNNSD